MNAKRDIVWAKLDRDAANRVLSALPLADHCLDVAAVFEALLMSGAWNVRLEACAGRPLTDQDRMRLIVLAALHDIGKANHGFQARWDKKAPKIGHESEVAALLYDDQLTGTPASKVLNAMLSTWGARSYLSAVMAHHGRTRSEYAYTGGLKPWIKQAQYWKPANGYDPAAAAAQLIDLIRVRYPTAWEAGEPLPSEPRFVALFAGLLVLADWIGSDRRRFPLEGPHGALREPMRTTAADEAITVRGLAPIDTPAIGFDAAFAVPEPRPVQLAATADDLGQVALIEAETGSGKTEAALWRWLDLRRRGVVDGLFFALPTRSAAIQLHGRVDRMLARVWGDGAPRAVLAVPGYLKMGDVGGERLPGHQVRWDDETRADAPFDARWAAEHSNQYLAARVAVGTIDQALLGALRIRHAPVRAAALARNLLVVDEVHASDAYMGGLLERLLANHVGAGGHALLLSATLGAAARARLLDQPRPGLAEAIAAPYPAVSGSDAPLRGIPAGGSNEKRVTIETSGLIADPEAIAAHAIEAAQAGASVLVVRNTVAGAVAVAQAVEALAPDLAFHVNGIATLHHGRFAPDDRRLLDRAVEAAFGKERSTAGRILVGTQTLEQSLDIDADLLITDLAPMDVLLQRIGRLHRHAGRNRGAFAEARAIVLRPANRDLSPLLARKSGFHGLGPSGHGGGPYPDLVQLEATLRMLEANRIVAIPADNRRLVEGALHPDAAVQIAEDLGVAWQNHAADRGGATHGDRDTAETLSLDLARPFRNLVFVDKDEPVLTRLGVRDLLIQLPSAPIGPFGESVGHMAIPSWMAGGVTKDDEPTAPIREGDGLRFDLGRRRFRYDRWGLRAAE